MGRAFIPHIITDDSVLGGSVIKNSLRFNRADTAYLDRTPSSAGNRKTFTISLWVKRTNLVAARLIACHSGNSDAGNFELDFINDAFRCIGWGTSFKVTNRLFRDTSAWYHIVTAVDTTDSTADNRIKIYVNGVQETSFSTSNNPSQNFDTGFNQASTTRIGLAANSISGPFDGYMAEINFVDGLQLTPSSFGYTDFQTGIWRPKKYEGSYNTNGFHLEFKSTSTDGSYTVPTASFTTDSDTALLINNNESNGSTTFTDSSSNGYSVSGTGGISHSTAQSKFGTSSIIFDGSDDSLTVGGNGTLYSELTASSNKTYEGWIWITARDYSWMFSSSSNQQYLGVNIQPAANGSYIAFGGNQPSPYTAIQGNAGGGGKSGSSGDSPSQSWPLNQWIHMFVQRNADGTMMVGADGQVLYRASEGANNTNSGTVGPLKIGSQHYYGSTHRNFFEGYMDELRISNTPRYSASYSGTVGDDTSGQGNTFAPNNFTSSDVLSDVPTNNFPTLNPLEGNGRRSGDLSNGNLDLSGGNYKLQKVNVRFGPDGIQSGKWYWEVNNSGGTYALYSGITSDFDQGGGEIAGQTNKTNFGSHYHKLFNQTGGASRTNEGAGVMSFLLDVDNRILIGKYKNVTIFTDTSIPNASTTTYAPFIFSTSGDWMNAQINFGQIPFTYTQPAGYKKISSNNIPVGATPSIIRPQKHFGTVLWTGNSSSSNRKISGLEFKPDLVWTKTRNYGYHHVWMDSVRGPSKRLNSDQNFVENNTNGGYLASFDEGGFTWQYGGGSSNEWWNQSYNYLAWCWKAGGAAVTNNDGTITTSVSVNEEAGFSIVSYSGTGSAGTIGHGLGKVPKCIITKRRTGTEDWKVYHSEIDGGKFLKLNATQAQTTNSDVYPNTAPTSSVYSLGNHASVNGSGDTYIAYCWTEIPGYSKFGSYEGNQNADGIYVHLGFKPAFIMMKNADNASNRHWCIVDSTRTTFNKSASAEVLFSDDAQVESYANNAFGQFGSKPCIDILSDGFKVREGETSASTQTNRSNTHIYMAFADQSGSTAYQTETNAE